MTKPGLAFRLLLLLTPVVAHAQQTPATPDEGKIPRVVALEWNLVEGLQAIGITPVGVADLDGYRLWVPGGGELETTGVGRRQEPSLERISTLDPDLIVGVSFRHADLAGHLESIAPTVLVDVYSAEAVVDGYEVMSRTLRGLGQAVGRPAEAEAALGGVDARLAEGAARLEEADLAGTRVLLVQPSDVVPTMRVMSDGSWAMDILERMGLENAWPGPPTLYGFEDIGVEELIGLEADLLLHVTQPANVVFAELQENPAWQAVPVVRQGGVGALPADTWLFGGPISAIRLAERVEAVLLEGD